MNNLVLGGVILASAGTFWLTRHTAVENARALNHTLRNELAVAQVTLRDTAAAVTNAQEQLATRRAAVDLARQELAQAAAAELPAAPPPPLDPAREGLWPAGKPYCYLAKKHLATIGFAPFTQDEHLTADAATLFGLSPAERTAVENAYQSFLDQVRQLHLTHVEYVHTKADVNTADHREITYRIPALTNELRAAGGSFLASLREALGSSRVDLFLKRGDQVLEEAFGPHGSQSYTITYYADRQPDGSVRHQLMSRSLDRPASYGYGVNFPLEPGAALWRYRHLFGEEPLISVPPTVIR